MTIYLLYLQSYIHQWHWIHPLSTLVCSSVSTFSLYDYNLCRGVCFLCSLSCSGGLSSAFMNSKTFSHIVGSLLIVPSSLSMDTPYLVRWWLHVHHLWWHLVHLPYLVCCLWECVHHCLKWHHVDSSWEHVVTFLYKETGFCGFSLNPSSIQLLTDWQRVKVLIVYEVATRPWSGNEAIITIWCCWAPFRHLWSLCCSKMEKT